MISIQAYRQQIGLFNINSMKFNTKNSQNASNMASACFLWLVRKLLFFLTNVLSVNTDTFVLLSTLSCHVYSLNPLFAPFSTLFAAYLINSFQFLLIHGYYWLVKSTYLFYASIQVLHHHDLVDTASFFYYKMLIMLTNGDIHPNPGPRGPGFEG